MDPELLSEATVTWIWSPSKSYPTQNDAAVLARFGPAVGPAVLTEIGALKDDFFRSSAFREVHGLAAIGDHAAAEFRARHPEISEDAVQALAACYTYAYK
jgi:hypothetical protein